MSGVNSMGTLESIVPAGGYSNPSPSPIFVVVVQLSGSEIDMMRLPTQAS